MPYEVSDGSTRRMIEALAMATESLRILAGKHKVFQRLDLELSKAKALFDMSKAIMRSLSLAKRDPHLDVSALLVPMAMDIVKLTATGPHERLDHEELHRWADHIEECRKVVAHRYDARKKAASKRRKEKANVTDD